MVEERKDRDNNRRNYGVSLVNKRSIDFCSQEPYDFNCRGFSKKESKAITFWKEECGYTEDNAPFDEILKNSDGVLENVKISVTNCYSETLFAEIKFRTLRLYKGETFYCLYKCAYNFFERYKDKIDKQPNVITWLGMEDEFVCLSYFNKKKNRKEVRFFNDNLCYYISFSCQSEGNE